MKSANLTTCRLGEVCAIEGTLVDPRDPKYRTLPHVGGANMVSGGGLTEVRAAGDDELISGKYLFSEEDVLYSKIRPYLKKVATPSFRGLCSADVYPLRPDKTRIERAFLLYLLLSPNFTDYAVHCSNRAGMPKVNREQLFAYSFKLPPLEEQRRTVARMHEALARADEIRKLHNESNSQRSALRKAARFDIWNKTASHTGTRPLNSIITSSRNGLYKPAKHHGQGTLIARMYNILDASFNTSKMTRLNVVPGELDRFRLSEGDIIVSRVNSKEQVGKSCAIPPLNEPTVYEAMIIRLQINHTQASPQFIAALMNAPQFLNTLRSKAKHAIGQSSISQDDLLSTELPIPSLTEQQVLAARMLELDKIVAKLTTSGPSSTDMNALRYTILRKFFTGNP